MSVVLAVGSPKLRNQLAKRSEKDSSALLKDTEGASSSETKTCGMYFFRHDDSSTNAGLACVGSVYNQLASSIPAFASLCEEALNKSVPDLNNLEALFTFALVDPLVTLVHKGG